MQTLAYRNGHLHVEDVALADITAKVGTPVYVYSAGALRRQYRVFASALSNACPGVRTMICYSVKANSNLAMIRTLARLGAGVDVVSEGELRRALAAGVPGERIVFSGVGKTKAEMAFALKAGIHQFNVESEPELAALAEVATGLGVRAPVALRVNPDVDAQTHAKISTGKAENKFGIPIARAPEVSRIAAALPSIDLMGVDLHIGSQLTSLAPFEHAFARAGALVGQLRADGHVIRTIDLGGGLGIAYRRDTDGPLPDAYAAVVSRTVGQLGCELIFEPGRHLVGNAGILATEVIYVKHGEGRNFVILDSAMNDLIRPAMYDAHHEVMPEREPGPDTKTIRADIVGPICETGDTFARDCEMPSPKSGDTLCFLSAGAYGAVMSSTYNTRLLVPEVLVDGDRFAVVRPRQTYDELIGRDCVPDWLEGDIAAG
ncbi:MAG: diaminopimelate decarboxylase [Pseudomonadota bacterium]|nr:diaminopimelate decarboxylase [Pseudomonadota bacterium]